jgi:putative ABC transport system substrate-binding protein
VVARAQQDGRLRRIGVLIGYDESDPEGKARLSRFTQGLTELGWTEGRNVRMEVRWAGGESTRIERTHAYAADLVSFKPDVIFAPLLALQKRPTMSVFLCGENDVL